MSDTSSTSRAGRRGFALPDFVIEILVSLVPITALLMKGAGWSLHWLIVVPLCVGVVVFWARWHLRRRDAQRRASVPARAETAADRGRRDAAAALARTLAATTTGELRRTAATMQRVEPQRVAEDAAERSWAVPQSTSTVTLAPESPPPAREPQAPAAASGLDDFDPGGRTRS